MTEQEAFTAVRAGAIEVNMDTSPDQLCQFSKAVHATLTQMAKASGWPKNAVLRTAAGMVTQARRKFLPSCR
jgi:hypothetical protein